MEKSEQINSVEEQRKAMVHVARQILDGKVGIVAGARELTRLRFPSRAELDSDILVFVGIDSETDHLPLGNVRRQWNAEVLKVKDEELKCYEDRVKERAFSACKNLIAKYDRLA
jgi:hypothetical protein